MLLSLFFFKVLIGLRDENDTIVSLTLIALAFLTQVLGSQLVVGGNRLKIFQFANPKVWKHILRINNLTLIVKKKQFNVPFRLEEMSKFKQDLPVPKRPVDEILNSINSEEEKE